MGGRSMRGNETLESLRDFASRRFSGVVKVGFVIDDADDQGARRALGNVLAVAQIGHGDLEHVAARAFVRVRGERVGPFHILQVHVVVNRHFQFALLCSNCVRTLPRLALCTVHLELHPWMTTLVGRQVMSSSTGTAHDKWKKTQAETCLQ